MTISELVQKLMAEDCIEQDGDMDSLLSFGGELPPVKTPATEEEESC